MAVSQRTLHCPNIFAAILKKVHGTIQMKAVATKIPPDRREHADTFLTQAFHPTTMKGESSPYFRTLQSDTPRRAGGLMSGAASKAVDHIT
jgi:hypothetical protein